MSIWQRIKADIVEAIQSPFWVDPYFGFNLGLNYADNYKAFPLAEEGEDTPTAPEEIGESTSSEGGCDLDGSEADSRDLRYKHRDSK